MSFEPVTPEEEQQFLENTLMHLNGNGNAILAARFLETQTTNLQNGLLTEAEFDRITSGRQVWQQWQYK